MQKRLLEYIFLISVRYGKFLLIGIVFITIVMGTFIPRLTISSSRQDLISADQPDQAQYLRFIKEFGTAENLIIVLEGDTETLKATTDLFANELEKEKKWVKSVFYKFDTDVLIKRALLFVPTKELKEGLEVLQKQRASIISRFSELNNLMAILHNISLGFKTQDSSIDVKVVPHILNGINVFFEEWNTWIEDPSHNRMKILDKLFLPGSEAEEFARGEGYLFSRDYRMCFIFVQPTSSSDEVTFLRPFISTMKGIEQRIYKSYPKLKKEIKVSYTGMPAHVLTETETIISDVSTAGSISTFLVVIILLIGFRSIKKMLVGVIPLVCGMVITLGIITLTIGRLNLISSAFMAVLFGIGIDFGIYIIRRTEEELGNGLTIHESVQRAVVITGKGIITGGLTTGLAFLAISFSDFSGYSELGISAGIGILLVLITTFLMMPALLLLIKIEPSYYKYSDKYIYTTIHEKKSGTLLAILIPSLVVAIFGIVAVFFIKMDYNVLDLLPRDTESTIYQLKMEKESNFNMSTAFVTANSLDKLKSTVARLNELPEVSRIDSLASLIPEDQEKKLEIIHKFRQILSGLRIIHIARYNSYAEYSSVLNNLIANLRNAQDKAFAGGRTDLVNQLEKVILSIDKVKEQLSGSNRSFALSRTKAFEKELFDNFSKMMDLIHNWLNAEEITENIFPEKVISRFKSPRGTYVAYVYPNGSIWDLDFLDKFILDLKKNADNVTGFPVTHRVYIRQAVTAVLKSMLYSLVIVLILLFLDFRKIKAVLLSLIPLIIGLLWLQGVLIIGRVSYNVANIAGLPLLLGLGVVYGVHIVHRWLENTETSAFVAAHTTGRGVAFAAFTTISGLGSIVFARHGGASTFGIILLFGILLCLLTALFILPAVIDLIFLKLYKGEKNTK